MSVFTNITVIYIILLAPNFLVDYKLGGFYFTQWVGPLLPRKMKAGRYIPPIQAFVLFVAYAAFMGWFVVSRLENWLDTSVYTNGGDFGDLGKFIVITVMALAAFNAKFYKKG